jgi:hypothetical protein
MKMHFRRKHPQYWFFCKFSKSNGSAIWPENRKEEAFEKETDAVGSPRHETIGKKSGLDYGLRLLDRPVCGTGRYGHDPGRGLFRDVYLWL